MRLPSARVMVDALSMGHVGLRIRSAASGGATRVIESDQQGQAESVSQQLQSRLLSVPMVTWSDTSQPESGTPPPPSSSPLLVKKGLRWALQVSDGTKFSSFRMAGYKLCFWTAVQCSDRLDLALG